MALWKPDPRYEEPPAELCALVDLVLCDLQDREPIAVQVGWNPDYVFGDPATCPPTSYLIFSEPDYAGGAGWTPEAPGWIGVDGEREWGDPYTPAELAVNLANYLQEQFFPETGAAWGQARPRCPGHGHPAVPRLIDGDAWWTCERDGRPIARFGALAGS